MGIINYFYQMEVSLLKYLKGNRNKSRLPELIKEILGCKLILYRYILNINQSNVLFIIPIFGSKNIKYLLIKFKFLNEGYKNSSN